MEIKVGDKNLNIRKWKGKDKKNFINALKKKKLSESEVMEALVYSCLDENVVLSIDEFRYILTRIRAISLGEKINFEFYCSECGKSHEKELELKDIIRYKYRPLREINVGDTHITIGDIKNRDAYMKRIEEDEMYDLLMRVETFNDDNTFTIEDLVDKFDELDVDVLEEIMEIYEDSKFRIEDENDVECPHCGHIQTFLFDDIPGFFPDSWFY